MKDATMKRLPICAIALALVAVLAACGGGGGASSPAPSGPTPTTASSTATATASPTATATASSTTSSSTSSTYTGRVVSTDSGNASVSGARILVGTAWTYQGQGYAISNVLSTATTAANGSFSINLPANATFIEVDAAGLVSAHRPVQTTPNSWGVGPLANSFGTIGLPTATADDFAELPVVNYDRATLGTGNGALALSLDADMELAARATTKNEGTLGYYAHEQPGTNYGFGIHYTCTVLVGAFCANPIYQDESLGAGPTETSVQMEQGNIALGPSDGHYQLVISATNLFVGFGEYLGGVPPGGSPTSVTTYNYQAQEYLTTSDNPSP